MIVTKKEALEFLREHYGLTLNEVKQLLGDVEVLHPHTMRDDLAKAALSGIISTSAAPYFRQDKVVAKMIAENAYQIADAMLAERIENRVYDIDN